MIVATAKIPDVKLIDPVVFDDSRGYFFEAYNEQSFTEKLAVTPHFFQDNESLSKRGTIRGLHLQRPPFAQAKLVWVITGEILDIELIWLVHMVAVADGDREMFCVWKVIHCLEKNAA